MRRFRKAIIATSILLLLATSAATSAAAATFDGEWNVQIASANTACGGGATVSIGINNGQVASTNGLMKASGRVADAGNINVTLTSGMKRAVGFGRLAAHRDRGRGAAHCARGPGPRSACDAPIVFRTRCSVLSCFAEQRPTTESSPIESGSAAHR